MSKLKNWFKQNVLRKEELTYRVYYKKYKDDKLKVYQLVFLDVKSTSKYEAREKTNKEINKYALQPELFKFVKVELL